MPSYMVLDLERACVVMAVALMFATNLEYHWEIAVTFTKVPGGAWAAGALQGAREGPAG